MCACHFASSSKPTKYMVVATGNQATPAKPKIQAFEENFQYLVLLLIIVFIHDCIRSITSLLTFGPYAYILTSCLKFK